MNTQVPRRKGSSRRRRPVRRRITRSPQIQPSGLTSLLEALKLPLALVVLSVALGFVPASDQGLASFLYFLRRGLQLGALCALSHGLYRRLLPRVLDEQRRGK